MPKDTFLNLPEDKRERILEAAIDEFAEYAYHKASITRIVERAEIAKGSFYQYFEDKKDIYRHLMNVAAGQKLEYFKDILGNMGEMDFFQVVRELYIGGIKFAQDRPKLSKIADDFMKNTDNKLREEIIGENMPKSNNLFEVLLAQGIEKGTIDSSIDIELVAFLFTSISVSIGEYFKKEVKVEDDMELMKYIDKMLYIFENGIRKK